MRELRSAARALRKNASFTTIAVLTLALGISANTAIFSVFKAVLLNPLPYREPQRLVTLAIVSPDMPDNPLVDPVTVEDWRTRSRSFESISLYGDASSVLMENGQGEIVRGLRVNSNFFDTLGVKMWLGRAFLPEEDRPDRKFTAIILSHGIWMRRFGGDPRIIGRVLDLNDFHYTVTGVLPADFTPLLHGTTELLPEIYMPAGIDYATSCRACFGPHAIARLRFGVSVEEARAELETVMRNIVHEHPEGYHRDTSVKVMPLRNFLFGRVAAALWAVLGAVAFVLLIACSNVANLLLAHAAARSRETALRAALGATRWHLIRQLLAESLALAIASGTAGLLLAFPFTRLLASILPPQIPRVGNVRIDAFVLAFSIAASLATAILCGLVPAWYATRIDLNESLKLSGRGTGDLPSHATRHMLVIGELALAFVLVSGAVLLSKSFALLLKVDLGYDSRNVLTLSSNVWGSSYDTEAAMLSYYQQALEHLHAVPGVEGAAWTSMLPLDAADRERLQIEERPVPRESDGPLVEMYSVSPTYFQVMKIPLKSGRLFTDQDTFTTPRVALISESCARAQFPSEDPIGKRIQLGGRDPSKPWATIVGVVGDVHQYGLDREPQGEAYIAQSQGVIIGYYRLVARTTIPPSRIQRAVQAAVKAVDPTLPVYHIKSLEDYLTGTLAPRTVALWLLGLFGILALTLAAVGVYGVISYGVTLRTREIGVRMALGAERGSVLSMIFRESLALAGIGVAIGFAASLFLTRFLASLLFGVRPTDALTISATAAVLLLAAILASYVPARRAASVDPMLALRGE